MLSGTTPGLLDPTQRTRLLRFPGSQLSFASFHPLAASSRREGATLNINENDRPKRIVIESLANGESFWRYVPRAKWASGVQDEGVWPRDVVICGYATDHETIPSILMIFHSQRGYENVS
jgi:hypothetical protein